MYQIFKNYGVKKMMTRELPSFAMAMLLAEFVYKFGSFTIECSAFLVTWAIFGWGLDKIIHSWPKNKSLANQYEAHPGR